MCIRAKIESMIPETPREAVKDFLRRVFYPDFGFSLDGERLATYHVKDVEPALWSADHQKPYGTIMTNYSFPHFLLARAVIRTCRVRSWCDIGTGTATLPLQIARHGVACVFGIEGSDASLRAGKVQIPLNNYCVADICSPLEIINENGVPAIFDVVSALELVEHIPDQKLAGFFDNIKRLRPKYAIFAIGLQPDPPYHVNLKSMSEWLEVISFMLPGWLYDDALSTKIFRDTCCHTRFINSYRSNHLPSNRNLVIFRNRNDYYESR